MKKEKLPRAEAEELRQEKTQCPECRYYFRSLLALVSHVCYAKNHEGKVT